MENSLSRISYQLVKPPPIPLENIFALGAPCLRKKIPAGWADSNGHMNMRWYVALFDEAADELYPHLGLSPEYHREHTTGTFDLEHHTHFLNEVMPGDTVAAYVRMLDCSEKRLHYAAFLVNESRASLAAIFECVNGMVDLAKRRTMPYPPEIRRRIEAAVNAAKELRWPAPVCGSMHS